MPLKRIAVAAGLFVLAALSARHASAQSYSFQTLDDPNGAKGTTATGINDLGQIVGIYTDSGSVQHGFTYSGGTFSDFTVSGSSATFLSYGINNAGAIVGSYTGNHGFIYSGGVLTTLDDPSAGAGTVARGINSAGKVVGYYLHAGGAATAFTYTGGTYQDSPVVSPPQTHYYGVNTQGSAVGYYTELPNRQSAFIVETDQAAELFDEPDGVDKTQAYGINDTRVVVGAFEDSSNVTHGFTWDHPGSDNLPNVIDAPGAISTQIFGINNAGDIVGSYTTSDNVVHGFLVVRHFCIEG